VDIDPLDVVRKVWRHNGAGYVWMPRIADIGIKSKERFYEGVILDSRRPKLPELDNAVDWYWTPGVSSDDTRKAKKYPAQRAVWVDCDDSYNDALLQELRPSFMWETSPGHKQAVWLLKDPLPREEFHRDGFVGLLTHALGADPSGVDVGQLLRVPGTWHHKRKPFHGKVLRATGMVYTRSMLLTRVAKGLGFPPGAASEIGAADPWGDRSKLLYKFARIASELGLDQKLAFKLLRACEWNKWKNEPERLREDIARAYEAEPTKPAKEKPKPKQSDAEDAEEEEELEAWDLDTIGAFGPVLRKPMKWVLPGIIPEAGCGLIVAAPKVGKTRIAIEVALGLASGRKPLGISTQRPQPVGFFSLEDGEYLFADRLNDGMEHGRGQYHWDGHIRKTAEGLTWSPPRELPLLTRFDPIDLSKPEDKQRLKMTIERYGLKLVIIDTLSMAIGDHNVSDQKEMNGILKDLRRIARDTKCAVMFIHHTRKRVFEKGETIQESILGATALHAWCEYVLSLAAPAEGEEGFLRLGVQTKMGSSQHYVNKDTVKIIKVPTQEEV
jgi:hypothetical protein